MDQDPVVADVEGMHPAQVRAAAELLHHELALHAHAEGAIAQLHEAVDHRMDGLHAVVLRHPARQEEYRARRERGVHLKLVDELLEFAVTGGGLADRGEPIQHDEPGTMGSKLLPDEVEQRLEAALLERAEAAHVGELLRNRRRIEERHVLKVLQQPRV